ncbi:hypothetical protein AB0K51_16635 [Kitasatospora sp. NPDC049285]|uniref:hypothetical protein n=1 Tax=Kitasatospora sp. NPDC049285 TaxID=3157096 RepID=UPI0034242152
MVHLARPVLRRVAAVRREGGLAQGGELCVVRTAGLPASIRWQPAEGDGVELAPPYRLERVELRGSHRARLHGLTAGVRIVSDGWAPLFLVSPGQLTLLALAAASTQRR